MIFKHYFHNKHFH